MTSRANIRKNHLKLKGLLLLFLFGMFSSSQAENLGVWGAVYSISEPDLLTGIYVRLGAMDKSGEIKQKEEAALKRSIAHILRPPPVVGVTDLVRGELPQSHEQDMSIKLNHDLRNKNGDLVARKGRIVNPLNHMTFREILIFINADNKTQLLWAKKYINENQTSWGKMKVILVKGDIKRSSAVLGSRVYFDQFGKLCERFRIKHTPTLVYQPHQGAIFASKLKVEEVAVE